MDNRAWDVIMDLLPQPFARQLRDKIQDPQQITELRIWRGKPVQIVYGTGKSTSLNFIADEQFCSQLLGNLTEHSLFHVQHQMVQGYITLPMGVRVGLGGRFFRQEEGRLVGMMPVTSFCFRVAREVRGTAETVMQALCKDNTFPSALVISPPGAGKTTLLRDMARIASNGGRNVTVIDERGELSGWHEGNCAFDLGTCTDVIYDLEKAQAIPIAVRALSPQIIVCDELGSEPDAKALREAARCGVSVFASAHGNDVEDLYLRPALRACMVEQVFSLAVILDGTKRGVVKAIERIKDDA